MKKRFIDGVIDGEYTLNTWIRHYLNEHFDDINTSNLIDMGGHDWFCTDAAFQKTILKDFAKKIVNLAMSPKIDGNKTYVFFKNICPCVGPLYNDFRICDINTGDVIYCITHIKKGCHGEDFSGWELWDYSNENAGSNVTHQPIIRGKWKTIKNYFAI